MRIQICFQHFKLLRRIDVDVLTIAAAIKATLGFNNPDLTAYADDIVRIKQLLLLGVIPVNDREILTTLITVLIPPFHISGMFAKLLKFNFRCRARRSRRKVILIDILFINDLDFGFSIVGKQTGLPLLPRSFQP